MQPRHATQDGFGFQYTLKAKSKPTSMQTLQFFVVSMKSQRKSKEIKGTDEASVQGGVPQLQGTFLNLQPLR